MKKYISIVLLSILSVGGYSQGITKSAKGEGSVLFRGHNATIDIGETELGFGLNNLRTSVGTPHQFVFGGNLKAKNETGIGGIFSKGDFVPLGSLNGFIGYSFSNGVPKSFTNEYEKLINEYHSFKKNSSEIVEREITNIISRHTTELADLRKELLDLFNKLDIPSKLVNELDKLNKSLEVEKKVIGKIKKDAETVFENLESDKKKYSTKANSMEEQLYKKSYLQLIVFGFGGVNATEFKRFTGFDSTSLKNSFNDEFFRGGRAGFGFNIQYGNIILGGTYSYNETNNFQLLTKNDYSLRTTTTVNNQSVVEEKKIAAYSGSYDKVTINELNLDLIINLKLDKQHKNHLLINPYMRSQLFSRKKDLLPNSTNVGCGFYFFQQTGKFLGGIYAELPDINNNYEKAKPIAEQNLRNPINRLSFGIVGKISIGSFLNLF